MKVKGKNFGDNIEHVWVILGKWNLGQGVLGNYPVSPISISHPDSHGTQELTFALPEYVGKAHGPLSHDPLYYRTTFTVNVRGRAGNWDYLNYVYPSGLWKIAGLTLLLLLTLLAPFLTVRHWFLPVMTSGALGTLLTTTMTVDYLWVMPVGCASLALLFTYRSWQHRRHLAPLMRTLFIDTNTNTYSLSKFQAFAWTVLLIGSYLYFAVCRGLLVDGHEIPDFNISLLGLMSISYGGLLTARGIRHSMPSTSSAPAQPHLSDLITEHGEISITRLQLLGFTIVAMIVYVYYVCSPDVFVKGIPDIPPTLHGLLVLSQGGYLGGKIVGEVRGNVPASTEERAVPQVPVGAVQG